MFGVDDIKQLGSVQVLFLAWTKGHKQVKMICSEIEDLSNHIRDDVELGICRYML